MDKSLSPLSGTLLQITVKLANLLTSKKKKPAHHSEKWPVSLSLFTSDNITRGYYDKQKKVMS